MKLRKHSVNLFSFFHSNQNQNYDTIWAILSAKPQSQNFISEKMEMEER